MKNIKRNILLVIAVVLASIANVTAQKKASPLTQAEAKVIIDSIGNILTSNYVFPEVADQMVEKINKSYKKGLYKSIEDHRQFAIQLTEDLQSVSHDKHLRIMYAPERIAAQREVVTPADSIKYLEEHIARMKQSNFGFKEVSILDGNIGYLNLTAFSEPKYAGETAVAAMNFLSNTDAIIIDLRNNGGGSPMMVQLIASYLFTPEPVHLNNFYWRPTDEHTQTWTLPHVPGQRNPDAAVYILTNSGSFSAAEEFSYDLKHLERATIVGETTGGGAHPGGTVNATDSYMVWLPSGRAINPITETNWEGTGVVPHISVPADQALDVAKMKALESLAAKAQGSPMEQYYNWHLSAQKAAINPVSVDQGALKSYVGTYSERKVTMDQGKLYYQRGDGGKYELKPVSQNEFMLVGMSDFRISFLSENQEVIALEGLYESGRRDKDLRSE